MSSKRLLSFIRAFYFCCDEKETKTCIHMLFLSAKIFNSWVMICSVFLLDQVTYLLERKMNAVTESISSSLLIL
jgi:hypothetical protein